MVIALFDTNILIDYLNGVEPARRELARYETKAISIVTWMEVMVGATGTLEAPTRRFLDAFQHVNVDNAIAERAIALRRAHRIKLPDAIVWASAQINAMLLVTRNTKDFPENRGDVRHPYAL